MNYSPDARMRANEQRVSTLQEAVDQEYQRYPQSGCPCVTVWIDTMLRESLWHNEGIHGIMFDQQQIAYGTRERC